jgi:hypothetical protein
MIFYFKLQCRILPVYEKYVNTRKTKKNPGIARIVGIRKGLKSFAADVAVAGPQPFALGQGRYRFRRGNLAMGNFHVARNAHIFDDFSARAAIPRLSYFCFAALCLARKFNRFRKRL